MDDRILIGLYLCGPFVIGLLLALFVPRSWCIALGAAVGIVLMVLNWTSDPGFIDVRDIVTVYLIVQFVVWVAAVRLGQALRNRSRERPA